MKGIPDSYSIFERRGGVSSSNEVSNEVSKESQSQWDLINYFRDSIELAGNWFRNFR